MLGGKAGLVAFVQNAVHHVTIWHCVLHCQVFVTVSSVTEPKDSVYDAKNVVNSISGRGLGGGGMVPSTLSRFCLLQGVVFTGPNYDSCC